MLLHWQKNRIALINLTYFLRETCSLPLARTALVKKLCRPILWPTDNATQFASLWLHFPPFFNCPPKEDCLPLYHKVEIAIGSSYFTRNTLALLGRCYVAQLNKWVLITVCCCLTRVFYILTLETACGRCHTTTTRVNTKGIDKYLFCTQNFIQWLPT